MPLPHWLATFNRVATNRVTRLVAGHLPGFGIIIHRGRRSGRSYRTPVNVFHRDGGYTVALTYGGGDWVKNVIAAGEAELLTRGRAHRVGNPRVVRDLSRAGLPQPARTILGVIRVDRCLHLDVVDRR
jgi:deazaflavin-dependent oxidoreductase (nitroreductase family)